MCRENGVEKPGGGGGREGVVGCVMLVSMTRWGGGLLITSTIRIDNLFENS